MSTVPALRSPVHSEISSTSDRPTLLGFIQAIQAIHRAETGRNLHWFDAVRQADRLFADAGLSDELVTLIDSIGV